MRGVEWDVLGLEIRHTEPRILKFRCRNFKTGTTLIKEQDGWQKMWYGIDDIKVQQANKTRVEVLRD